MALADRVTELLDGLPRGWESASLELTVDDADVVGRVALILAPAAPGRSGESFLLDVRSGPGQGGTSPRVARRVLERLDKEGIRARLSLGQRVTVAPEPSPAGAPGPVRPAGPEALADEWDRLLSRLPADWSDLYVELELDSSDFVDLGALRLAPVNPVLVDRRQTFRFRCARRFGYGVAPGMARRCLERLDEDGITGALRILRALSDARPVATQGPVWRVGGKSV